MDFPALTDTIVAVATGWEPAAFGIVRLSGPRSIAIAAALTASNTSQADEAHRTLAEARIGLGPELKIPATILRFRAPHSYTGQDVVELHTTGCLPLLCRLCDACLALGARRALPGEFTARAFLAGKLDRSQVNGVLQLIHAHDTAGARTAARAARGDARRLRADLLDRLLRLLALIEAGIDFVEEEDVRFVSPAEVVAELDALLDLIDPPVAHATANAWSTRPHVALVGRPNAGKSTLFNALLGYERAIVSPVVGTTRDVLSAEWELAATKIVLQDCAGLGESVDELELAAHRATEHAAELADVVLWVHASDEPWTPAELAAFERIPADRLILVRSKYDAPESPAAAHVAPVTSAVARGVSALTGAGMAALRDAIAALVADRTSAAGTYATGSDAVVLRPALERARTIAEAAGHGNMAAELVALELRTACSVLQDAASPSVDEAVLDRIFGQFCIGK